MFSSVGMNCILRYSGQQFTCTKFSCYSVLRRLLRRKNFNAVSLHSYFTIEPCSQISTMPISYAKPLHTTKGWKYIARDGERQDRIYGAPPEKCEEGNEAILHADLISKLQNCSSVASQIDTFCSLLSLTSKDLERRKAFVQSLEDALKIYFPDIKISLFGSSVNGLGFKGCDADVCIQTSADNEDTLLLKEVPTLDSVLNGTISQETISHMNPLYTLRFVRRILRKHCPDVNEPILLVKARCPILRFYNAKYDVFCDFSCENRFSLRNTKLLQIICGLDPRFAPLVKIIRYWGKYGGFVGDIEMFNSYSFSLLAVHFLQVTNPPVLPSVSEIINKSEYLEDDYVGNDELLQKDLKKFSPSKNVMTVEELVRRFYFYFANYEFSRIMQPFTSTSVPRSNFEFKKDGEDVFESSSVSIQDPFRPSFNATATASFKSGRKFLNGLMEACKAYQDESKWIPGTQMWGLCSLFLPPMQEKDISENWQKSTHHTIEIPSRPEAAENLKRILEYGLLFHCTEFRVMKNKNHETNSKSIPILKLRCKAYYNTWQGRDWVLPKFQENNNHLPLELEHLISSELIKKTENKRQILCEFLCECHEIIKNNESKLILTLNFGESKCPPIVAIFLKEYIPCIFRKL